MVDLVVMRPLTGILLEAAYQSATSCDGVGSHDEMAAAAGAIVLSQCALESFINEEIGSAQYRSPTKLPWHSVTKLLSRASIEQRWEIFIGLHLGHAVDMGAEPFQSFAALVRLRNAVAHHSPQFVEDGHGSGWPKGLKERLETRYPLRQAQGKWAPWQELALTREGARWACETAVRLLQEYGRLGGFPMAANGDPFNPTFHPNPEPSPDDPWCTPFAEGEEPQEPPHHSLLPDVPWRNEKP